MFFSERKKYDRTYYIVCVIVFLVLLASTLYYTFFLDAWFDEGNYTYKSWLTTEDVAYPFLDFRTKYPPFAFYTQSILQHFVGPSILAARILSSFFLVGLTLLLFDIGRREGGKWLGLAGASLLVFHPYLVGFYSSAVPYAMTMFFALLSIWILYNKKLSPEAKIIYSSFAAAIAFLVRYNMFPFLILVWLLHVFLRRKWTDGVLSACASLSLIGIALLPYLALDVEFALSMIALMFGPFAKLVSIPYADVAALTAAHDSFINLIFSGERFKIIIAMLAKYYMLWTIFTASIFILILQYKQHQSRLFKENLLLVFGIITTIAMTVAHFVFGPNYFVIYSLYVIPFLILSIVLFLSYLKKQNIFLHQAKTFFISLFIAGILLTPVSTAISRQDVIFFNRFDLADTDLARVERGGAYLKSVTKPEDRILPFFELYQSFLAERVMFPELIARGNEFTETDDYILLDRFARFNSEQILKWARQDATIITFNPGFFEENEAWVGGPEIRHELMNIIDEQYELVGIAYNVYPRRETRGEGEMYVYRRMVDVVE